MRIRSAFAAALIAIGAAFLPAGEIVAQEKTEATADQCRGVNMLAETAEKDPSTYARIMEEAAKTENGNANLWKIEKEGVPASYLFGTVHLTDERVTTLPPAVRSALDESKTVALEVSDLSEAATASVIASSAPLVMFTDGRRLDQLLSESEYEVVKSVIGRAGMPDSLAAMFRPWIVTMILSVSDCEREKVKNGVQVLDMRIAEYGKKRGVDVIGLETIPEQIQALAAVPEQQQLDMLRSSLKFADRSDDLMETLIQLYLERKITAALPFQIALAQQAGIGSEAFAGFQQKLIVERNIRMMNTAEPLLEKGHAFIAVGALHLPGERGLVDLMRRAGYTVTAVE